MRHRDGSYRWMSCRGLAARDEAGRATRFAGFQTDVTDRKSREAELVHEALHDPLTGLPNRALFLDRLGRSVERVKRHAGHAFAALVVDLDRFNIVNEPGVEAASLASTRLLEGNQWTSDFTVEGYRHGADEDMEQNCNTVGPGYFRAMGIPLLMGREFEERDERLDDLQKEDWPFQFRVAIANQRFVKRYFGDRNPIGRRVGFGTDPGRPTPIEIVGVVADSKYTGVRDETQRQLFFPFLESARPRGFTAYVRTRQPPEATFNVVGQIVRQLDPNLPVAAPRTLQQQVAQSLSRERMVATMSGVFGTLATLLAVVGLYGVMAYTVARRTREIGIRMALGARVADITWMVVREVVAIVGMGMTIALIAAWWLGRLVASELYGVAATDPPTLAAAVLLLAVVSLLAALLPSRRAARVEPTTALRYE